MLVILISSACHPDDVPRMRELVLQVARESRKEPACMAYSVAVDAENPNLHRVAECWAGVEEHRAHMTTPHVRAFFAQSAGLRGLSRSIGAFEVARRLDIVLPEK